MSSRPPVSEKLIPVLPTKLRRLVLAAIAVAERPVVLLDDRPITDFSEAGPLTQRGLRQCIDFEVRDGDTPVLGFHDDPREMWIVASYREFAEQGAREGWLKIQGPAS